MNRWLRVLLWSSFVWSALLLGIATGALIHSYYLHDKVGDGLLDAMKGYRNDSVSKKAIDMLQVQFQCCGSRSYKDWFNIPWFDADLADL